MLEWAKIIVELLKLAPGIMFAIALTCFALLVLPANVSAVLGLAPVIEASRGWLVISCFFSCLVAFFYGPIPWIVNRIRAFNEARRAERELQLKQKAEEIKGWNERLAAYKVIEAKLLSLTDSQKRLFASVFYAKLGFCWLPQWHSDCRRLLDLELIREVVPSHGDDGWIAVGIDSVVSDSLEEFRQVIEDFPSQPHRIARFENPGEEIPPRG